jgi:hypothetical protein
MVRSTRGIVRDRKARVDECPRIYSERKSPSDGRRRIHLAEHEVGRVAEDCRRDREG